MIILEGQDSISIILNRRGRGSTAPMAQRTEAKAFRIQARVMWGQICFILTLIYPSLLPTRPGSCDLVSDRWPYNLINVPPDPARSDFVLSLLDLNGNFFRALCAHFYHISLGYPLSKS
jgi:hypothetical protein